MRELAVAIVRFAAILVGLGALLTSVWFAVLVAAGGIVGFSIGQVVTSRQLAAARQR